MLEQAALRNSSWSHELVLMRLAIMVGRCFLMLGGGWNGRQYKVVRYAVYGTASLYQILD